MSNTYSSLLFNNYSFRLIAYLAFCGAKIQKNCKLQTLCDIIFIENGEEYRAFAEDVDSMGFLKIVLPDGKRRILSSGEISVKVEGHGTEV